MSRIRSTPLAFQAPPTTVEESNQIHLPYIPADIRRGDIMKAFIKSTDPAFNLDAELQVWRVSPLGIELVVPKNYGSIPKGLKVDLRLEIGKQQSFFEGLTVDLVVSNHQRTLLGVRLTKACPPRTTDLERRKTKRWQTSPQFYPTAVSTNPARFNDFLYFTIKDISEKGFQLLSSLRNKFLFPGMTFKALVSFPLISQVSVNFTVKNIRVVIDEGQEKLAIGCEIQNPTKKAKETIAQYLVQFGEISNLEDLKANGIVPKSLSKAIDFSFVRTEDDYRQVLELRHKAYSHAGKIAEGTRVDDMADMYDSRSRIVIGKCRGRVIATCRLTFSSFEDRMEQEEFVKWPTELPRRDDVVEMMRLCTDPDFRGSDLILEMFEFMALAVVQSGRQWVVICSTDEMSEFYEKVGFKRTDLIYNHPKLNNTEHTVFYANVADGMNGIGIGPIYWNIVWKGVSHYMKDYSLITVDPLANVRVLIYRLLSPLADFAKWLRGLRRKVRK